MARPAVHRDQTIAEGQPINSRPGRGVAWSGHLRETCLRESSSGPWRCHPMGAPARVSAAGE